MKHLKRERTCVRLTLFSGLSVLSLLVICLSPGLSLGVIDRLLTGSLVAMCATMVAHIAFVGFHASAARRHGDPENLVPVVDR